MLTTQAEESVISESAEVPDNPIGDRMGIALTVIPCITATISFFSSAYLIWSIVRRKNEKHRSRDGILLGLSFLNLLFSAACAMSTFTAPEDLDQFEPYIIRGTIATCEMQGWLYQAGTSVPIYNSCLSCYYLLRVKFQRTDRDLKVYVSAVHTSVLLWSFGSATAGLILDLYNFGGLLGCWIYHNHDIYCDEGIELESCGRGSNHDMFLWLFGAAPVLIALLATMVATSMMYCAVRSHEAMVDRSSFEKHNRAIAPPRSSSNEEKTNDDFEIENMRASSSPTTMPPPTTNLWKRLREYRSRQASIHKISTKVRDSGLLYMLAFWITYLPMLLLEIFAITGAESSDLLRIANVTLLPLQGFFNLIIYQMPRWQYLRNQRAKNRSSIASSVTGFRRGRRADLLASGERDSQEPARIPSDMPGVVHISSQADSSMMEVEDQESCESAERLSKWDSTSS